LAFIVVIFSSLLVGLLHRSAERFLTEPEDRALAEAGDSQGVGGTPGSSWKVAP
jgi:hypothetical protein